jgi:FtsP/CotA-like multicopper oxidase with cupredoxin domain
MDGVAGVTQAPIEPMTTDSRYLITAPDAGTFWYHPHLSTFRQLGMGLCGALIVQEQRPIRVDADVVILLQEWFLEPSLARPSVSFYDGRVGDASKNPYRCSANGGRLEGLDFGAAQIARIRLINAAGMTTFSVGTWGLATWWVAADANPLPHPSRIDGTLIALAPGQRLDLIVQRAEPGSSSGLRIRTDFEQLLPHAQRGGFLLPINMPRGYRARGAACPVSLPPNDVREPDLPHAERFEIRLQHHFASPAARRAYETTLERTGLQDKSREIWTLNGATMRDAAVHGLDHAPQPLLSLKAGRSYVLRVINDSDEPHPMHLHGHFFREVARNGRPLTRRLWRDTSVVGAHGSIDIAFVADNPGDWMFHCHNSGHQFQGMMGIVRVES